MDIKVIAAFVVGAAAGAAGATLYFKEKYKAESDNEIRQMREYYKKKMAEADTYGVDEEGNCEEPEEMRAEHSAYSSFDSLIKDEEAKKAYVNYNTVNPAASLTKEEFDEMRERAMMAQHPEEDHDEPYILTVEEFEDGRAGYDSIGLSYYEGDDTLVDESEEMVEADETIGTENLEWFKGSGTDAMYIRNDRVSCDYEVIRLDGNFYDPEDAIFGDDEV